MIDQWMKSCSGRKTWRDLDDHLSKIGEDQLGKEFTTIILNTTGEYAALVYRYSRIVVVMI